MTGRPKKSPFLFVNPRKSPSTMASTEKGLYLMTIIVILFFRITHINYFLRPKTQPKPFNQPKLTHWEQNYYIIYDLE